MHKYTFFFFFWVEFLFLKDNFVQSIAINHIFAQSSDHWLPDCSATQCTMSYSMQHQSSITSSFIVSVYFFNLLTCTSSNCRAAEIDGLETLFCLQWENIHWTVWFRHKFNERILHHYGRIFIMYGKLKLLWANHALIILILIYIYIYISTELCIR